MSTIKFVTFISAVFDLVTVPRLWNANVVTYASKLVCGTFACTRCFICTILYFVNIIYNLQLTMLTITYRTIFNPVTPLSCINTTPICVTTPLERIARFFGSSIGTSNFVGIIPTIVLAITKPIFMDTISSEIAIAKVSVVKRDTVGRLAIHFVRTVRAIRVGVASQRFHHAFAVFASEKAILRTSTI